MRLPKWLRRLYVGRKLRRRAYITVRVAAWHSGLIKTWDGKLTLEVVEKLVVAARAERNIRLLREAGIVWRELRKKNKRDEAEDEE